MKGHGKKKPGKKKRKPKTYTAVRGIRKNITTTADNVFLKKPPKILEV